MCGRFVLTATPEELQALFGYLDPDDFPPRYNIAPTQPIAIVRFLHGARRFALVRWGLVPPWVEDPGNFPLIINARAETVLEKPSVRNAMRYRRCLVPASGFYEWRRGPGRSKQPFYLRPEHGGHIAFAGLWETWSDRDGGEIDTACIVTTDANQETAPLHDRMPVVVAPEDFDIWLKGDAADAVRLLRPPPDGFFRPVRVGDRVNAAVDDDPGLLEPVPEEPDLFSSL